MARSGADPSQLVHDRAHHSVANHGQDGFADRTFGNYAHAAARIRQRGIHLFCSGDSSDFDFRTFCLWLGLSHSGLAGFLRVDAKEDRSHSEAVSIEIVGIRPAHWRAVYVCLA